NFPAAAISRRWSSPKRWQRTSGNSSARCVPTSKTRERVARHPVHWETREAIMALTIGRKTPREWWREYRSTVLFLFCMLMFRSAWADWVTVPTGSMNPTIIEGDRVLVNKHVFGLRIPWTLVRLTDVRDPQRGEIVVFASPANG